MLFALPEINFNFPLELQYKTETLEKISAIPFLADVYLYLNSESTCIIQGLPN